MRVISMRKDLLANEEIYHILNRSIAEYKIVNDENDFVRMVSLLKYYRIGKPPCKFSQFTKLSNDEKNKIFNNPNNEYLVDIISYCIMPTHPHLVLKQLIDDGISRYMSNILNSYSKYFNTKHLRKGPLWESRFKNILVENDQQLLHLTRYIHLNPVTAGLVEKPEDWFASSYKEYLKQIADENKICKFDNIFDFTTIRYKKFVEDRTSYQKQLSRIKRLILE